MTALALLKEAISTQAKRCKYGAWAKEQEDDVREFLDELMDRQSSDVSTTVLWRTLRQAFPSVTFSHATLREHRMRSCRCATR